MSDSRNVVPFSFSAAPVALLFLLIATPLRGQEIRVLAEPNQSIRMGRGGYVCDGQLTHTPIDATENWTYELVECTGPMYNSYDYAALNAKLSHDELVRMNETLDRMSRASQGATDKQARELNSDLKATIEKRFEDLPQNVLLSADVQALKKNLMDYVDQRVTPYAPPPPPSKGSALPRTHRTAPTSPSQP